MARGGKESVCERCDGSFVARSNHSSFRQRYCSPRCANEAKAAKIRASYPPKGEIEALVKEGLSDEKIGRRYGRSYTWAWRVRQFHELPPGGLKPGPRRKPLHQRSDRDRWGIHLKREERCRSCKKGGRLNLHHAIPRSLAPSIKFDLRNGIPLCTACHMAWHHHERAIYRDVFTEEEWSWLTSLQFQGIEIKHWLEDHYPERPNSWDLGHGEGAHEPTPFSPS